jgi:hypothetical protein
MVFWFIIYAACFFYVARALYYVWMWGVWVYLRNRTHREVEALRQRVGPELPMAALPLREQRIA